MAAALCRLLDVAGGSAGSARTGEASGLVRTAARAMLAAIDRVFDQSRRWLGVPGRAGFRAVTATMRYHPPRSRRKAWPARAASEAVISRVPFLRQYVKIAAR